MSRDFGEVSGPGGVGPSSSQDHAPGASSHATYYREHTYSAAENERFTAQFDAITAQFIAAMDAGLPVTDDQVQHAVAQHYEFCTRFWQPNRETYISLAMNYLLPTPYRDTYESLAPGLGKYHYDAITVWANANLS